MIGRVATATIFSSQIASIDNLSQQTQTVATDLSSGISFQGPSDNPVQVPFLLSNDTAIATDNQSGDNLKSATATLTETDSALANVTTLLQSARQFTIQGSTDTLTPQQLQAIGNQVDQLLQQTIAAANTNVGGQFIFGGTGSPLTAPVTTFGSPISAVTFNGNLETQNQAFQNGQSFALTTNLQQAFNFQAADNTPDAFTLLQTLRDTLNKGLVVDQSAAPINHQGQVVFGAGSPVPTTLASPTAFAVRPQPDNGAPPGFTIQINNADANGVQHVQSYTFTAATAIDDGTPASIVGQINAQSGVTGLTASFNAKTQRFTLTNAGGGAFFVKDVPSPGATTTSNLTQVLGLAGQADLPQTLSTQIGDIDHVLNVVLNARSEVGAKINSLSQIGEQLSATVNENTKTKSNIEDTDVAHATSQLTLLQTALQASFAVTSRIEQAKGLIDFI